MLTKHQAPATQEKEAIKTLKQALRQKAVDSLRLTLNSVEPSLSEVSERDDFLYGQLMGYVMIHSSALKLIFKVHYSREQADQMSAAKLGLPPSELRVEWSDDFMREYCNLAAGYMADWLTRHAIPALISIPLVTDGFDEVWFSDKLHPLETRDYWMIHWADGHLVCTASYIVHDEAALATLKECPPATDPRSAGGVTIL